MADEKAEKKAAKEAEAAAEQAPTEAQLQEELAVHQANLRAAQQWEKDKAAAEAHDAFMESVLADAPKEIERIEKELEA